MKEGGGGGELQEDFDCGKSTRARLKTYIGKSDSLIIQLT